MRQRVPDEIAQPVHAGLADAGRAPRLRERPPPVLMYHSVTPYAEDPYQVTVSPRRFEQQMRWLDTCGLRGVSMATLLRAQRRGCAAALSA